MAMDEQLVLNQAVFGPMTSDPGNPGKLINANRSALDARNKKLREALSKSKAQTAKELEMYGKKAPVINKPATTTANNVAKSGAKLGTGGKAALIGTGILAAGALIASGNKKKD